MKYLSTLDPEKIHLFLNLYNKKKNGAMNKVISKPIKEIMKYLLTSALNLTGI
jgi:hypothetical protein